MRDLNRYLSHSSLLGMGKCFHTWQNLRGNLMLNFTTKYRLWHYRKCRCNYRESNYNFLHHRRRPIINDGNIYNCFRFSPPLTCQNLQSLKVFFENNFIIS